MGGSESRCFGNYIMTVEPGDQQWRSFLKQECEDLKEECSWAAVVLK